MLPRCYPYAFEFSPIVTAICRMWQQRTIFCIDGRAVRNARTTADVDGTHVHASGPFFMSQLAAGHPTHPSSKPTLGGLIKSALIYALLSAIPPAKRAGPLRVHPEQPVRRRATGQRRRSADLKQEDRAAEDGRGRHASAPWQIPWAGWKDILWRTYARIGDDRLLAVAAGVVFYGLLALFPAITALVSLYGLFAKASTISEHLSLPAGFFRPAGSKLFRSRSTGSQQKVTRSSALPSRRAWDLLFGVPMPE